MAHIRTIISGKASNLQALDTYKNGMSVLDSVRDSLSHIGELVSSAQHAMSEFIQIQKMASMENLATSLAHDITSCLMSLGYEIRFLEKTSSDKNILKRINRMQRVMDDLDALVRRLNMLGPEELPVDIVPRDLSIEIKKVLDAMSSSLRPDILLHLSTCSFPLPVPLCQGDAWRILNNLVKNAQEAMPNGGDLLIGSFLQQIDSAYCRKHGNARRGTFAVLSVSDHGIGMSQETLNKIFDPLFSTKSKEMHKGKHGWGLAIVYSLVHRRGGWIDVSSIEGQGSTFKVFLPLYSEERS